MTRANRIVMALAAVALCGACENKGIGLKCINPTGMPPVGGTELKPTDISSPALECHTRICIITRDDLATNNAMSRTVCTDFCQTDDDCKDGVVAADESGGQCSSTYRCAVATLAGDYKCKKICVCQDDLVCGVNKDSAGNIITPKACPGGIDPPPGC